MIERYGGVAKRAKEARLAGDVGREAVAQRDERLCVCHHAVRWHSVTVAQRDERYATRRSGVAESEGSAPGG